MNHPLPLSITLSQDKRSLKLVYADKSYILSAEYLRVYSPSAEVVGHHPSQAVLQVGKKNILIIEIHTVGNYALKIIFNDGHNTGLYNWDYLFQLAHEYDTMWANYISQLQKAGASREVE